MTFRHVDAPRGTVTWSQRSSCPLSTWNSVLLGVTCFSRTVCMYGATIMSPTVRLFTWMGMIWRFVGRFNLLRAVAALVSAGTRNSRSQETPPMNWLNLVLMHESLGVSMCILPNDIDLDRF